MKAELCKAFCDAVTVTEVPVGLAVSTVFRRSDGDAIGFYVIADADQPGAAHLEDDGETIPYLESCGVDFGTQTRQKAFRELLDEHGAGYDEAEAVIRTPPLSRADLPSAALRFAALLLRLSDFLLLTQEHVESTFREDARRHIRAVIGDRAVIREDEPVSSRLREVVPDMVLEGDRRPPVAVFLAQSSQRLSDAVFLQMAATHEVRQHLAVIALIDREASISRDLRQRAANRLTAVPIFLGDEDAAVQRIEREVLGQDTAVQ